MNKLVTVFAIALILTGAQELYSQSMMRMYRSVYSVAGYYGSSSSSMDIDQGSGVRMGGTTDSDVMRISTRDGYFILRHLALGGEFSWEHRSTSYQPDPNPINFRSRQYARRLFAGPWLRWYVPASMRWYTALELSFGYVHEAGETEESTAAYVLPRTTTSANGFGVNAGLGMGYLVGRNVTLDLTARYGAGWLSGEYHIPGNPDLSLDMDFGEISFLLGIQLLM